MPTLCETHKDALMETVYAEKAPEPALQEHLQACADCRETLSAYEGLRSLFQRLPDREPPAKLTTQIFSQIEEERNPSPGFFGWIGRWMLHPATVGAMVFTLTLGGTLAYKRYWAPSPGSLVATREGALPSAPEEMRAAVSPAPSAPFAGAYLKMVDWNPTPRLIPDLDRPVLRVADMATLEQASLESVASFKHQIAMRHILDGEYDKACRILDSVIDQHMNYSHWDQAVVLHLTVMKKLGRQDEVQRDLRRLREYAMSNPDFVSQVERDFKN